MQPSLIRINQLCCLLVLAIGLTRPASAQTSQVFVNAGQTLTDVELTAGSFFGQDFVLQPGTTFEIAGGGLLGPVSNPVAHTDEPFNFAGSTANINAGGQFGGRNTLLNEVENLTLNILPGGEVTTSLVAFGSNVNLAGGTTAFVEVEAGSTLNVTGGSINSSSRAQDSTVNIAGGTVGDGLSLHRSNAQITGGTVDRIFSFDGSTTNLSSGTLRSFTSSRDSTLNITGGALLNSSRTHGTLNASGGTIGRRLRTGSGTTFIGGEFFSNQSLDLDSPFSLRGEETDILSGTFADGSPFVFSLLQGDSLIDVTLVPEPLPAADTTPIVVDSNSPPAPNGLRRGQSLTLLPGGTLNANTAVVGATLVVDGGLVGDSIDVYQSDIQLRTGTIDHNLHLLDGTTLDISGGSVGDFLRTFSGSTTNISGGRIGQHFLMGNGSTVSVTGGSISDGFSTDFFSPDVSLTGGEFKINGVPYTGDTINMLFEDVFTGTLADGSPFIFGYNNSTQDQLRSVRLISAPLPAVDLTPIVVDSPSSIAPTGLRAGQTLTLGSGGSLPENFEAVDATLNINDGFTRASLKLAGGVANITGGIVGDNATTLFGNTLNLSGGTIGDFFHAAAGSTVNITGGKIGQRFEAASGSTINLSGGTIAPVFQTEQGSTLNLFGGEFQLNGQPYTDNTLGNIDFRQNVFSGTLADGSTFVFSGRFPDLRLPDRIAHANLIDTPLPDIDLTPIIVGRRTTAPSGLRPGQTLSLEIGGRLPADFVAIDSHLTINGGSIGPNMQLVGTDVEINGGTIDENLDVRIGSTVDIFGGRVTDLTAFPGSTVNIAGGRVDSITPSNGGLVNVTGGSVGNLFMVRESTFNISGGSFDQISASDGTINLFVTEFLIDGLPAALEPTIPTRFRTDYSTLYSATLLDGSLLEFRGADIRSTTNLNVTLVPEPSAMLLMLAGATAGLSGIGGRVRQSLRPLP